MSRKFKKATAAQLRAFQERDLAELDVVARAHQRPTYDEAKRELGAIRAELDEINQSAVASLDEGFEETLTLHRLGVFPLLGHSLKSSR